MKDKNAETLAEGSFDSLLVTKEALFYRDTETKQYFRSAFEDGALKEAELWAAYAEGAMPFLDGEWIYYELGDYFYHYKVSLTDKTMMGRYTKTSADMLISNGQKYEINRKTDLNTGEESTFTDKPYTRLIGIAGSRLIYEAYDYTEDALLTEHPVPESIMLYSYDTEKGETVQLAGAEKPETFDAEKAVSYYERLQRGELTLLKEDAESFVAHFKTAAGWKHYDVDLDGDHVPERFLYWEAQKQEEGGTGDFHKKSVILHADWDGISLYQTDYSTPSEWYEPLEDGTILYRYVYELGGYGSQFYEVYRFEPGGKRVLVSSYQHVTAALQEIAYDAQTDSQIQQDQYYAGEAFTDKADWTKQVEAVLKKRVMQGNVE